MKTEEIKFEKAMTRLEEIVSRLEDGSLSLDQALASYEEGVKLARLCATRLAEAEKKVELLTKTLDGSWKPVPFNPEETSQTLEAAAGDVKPRARKRRAGTEKPLEDA